MHPDESLTPLVGREEEIGYLLKHWQLAREGLGQVALISGEAGMGILGAGQFGLGTFPPVLPRRCAGPL